MSGQHRRDRAPDASHLAAARPAAPGWGDGPGGLPPSAIPAGMPTRGTARRAQPPFRPPGEDSAATVQIPRALLSAWLPDGPDPSPPTAATPLPRPESTTQPVPLAKRRRPGRPALTKPVGPPEALRPPSMRRMAIGCAVLVAVVAVVLFLAACAPTLMSSGSVPPPAGLVSTLDAPASLAPGGGHR